MKTEFILLALDLLFMAGCSLLVIFVVLVRFLLCGFKRCYKEASRLLYDDE